MSAIETLTMPNTYVRLMLQAAQDPQQILVGSGLCVEQVRQGNAEIEVWQQLVCARNSAAVSRSPHWHLNWADRIAEHFHGPVTAAWLSAPTLGDGLDIFVRYIPDRAPYLSFRSAQIGDCWQVELRSLMELGDIAAMLIELPLLTLAIYIHRLLGKRVEGLRCEFPHQPLASIEHYRRLFHGELTFEAGVAALSLPAAYRNLANPGYDRTMWNAARRRCEAAAQSRASQTVVNRIVEILLNSLDEQAPERVLPTLSGMAEQLHISVSTLNRRLRAANITYQALVDDARSQRAKELLGNPQRRVIDIAHELGFRDTTSFVRSFRRWYGTTPGRYRRRIDAVH